MRVTIADVAREAKCSVTSVSLVLNNKKNTISEEKKQKIFAAAKRLNYVVNRRAASLVTQKTNIIGLIIPDNCNNFFGSIARKVEFCASNRGYSVLYGNSNNNITNDQRYFRMFSEQCVEGILMVKSATQNQAEEKILADMINQATFPVVLLDRVMEGAECTACVVDNFFGGYIATRHLLEYGHRRIGCLTGPLNISSAVERLRGYRKALMDFGVAYDERMIMEGDYQLGKGQKALEQFEAMGVTAIFAQNDVMAFELYREISKIGKRIPDDYSIVGFDDLFESGILSPALTSVRQPAEDLAQKATLKLIAQIENAETADSKLTSLQPKLIIRESVKHIG